MLDDLSGLAELTSAVPSPGLAWLCLAITLAVAAALPAARAVAGQRSGEPPGQTQRATLRTGLGLLAWLGLTGALAGAGVLAKLDRFPPPLMPLLFGGFVLVFVLALSGFGRRLIDGLPLWLLVGYQGFRVVVELMLHRAGVEGVIGMQMTWSGLNFDVVSGLSALVLGAWLWSRTRAGKAGIEAPGPRVLVWIWNLGGLALLITIVSIAILSIPGPLRQFDGPPNVWVTTVPFVWLPTMMVTAALFGHVLVARRLLRPPQSVEFDNFPPE